MCMDCGGPLPERPVVVLIDGDPSRFCGRACAAGFLGALTPGECCVHEPEVSKKGGDTR